ncbi:MAG TPA: VOC family protein [Acidimicrobiales bacterium]|nr:VOC family protein [Acidimicrobiales bacterium]
MEPKVSIITLGCPDVAALRRFYVEGLGWTPVMEVPGEVCFIQVGGGVALALWRAEALAEDSGAPVGEPGSSAVALAHNVDSGDEVVEVLARAEAAGATVLKPAGPIFFGGIQGYFADPAGFRWEVAWNPGWFVAPDGSVSLAGPPE